MKVKNALLAHKFLKFFHKMPLHMFIHEKRENIFILLRNGKKEYF